jgi:hypothetical protein
MELLINLKLIHKIYDTKYFNDYEDCNITNLPFDVIVKITNHVDMNNKQNIKRYNLLIKKINGLTNYKIYIDYFGDFRRVILKTNKIILLVY